MTTPKNPSRYLSFVILFFLFAVALSSVRARHMRKDPYKKWYTGKRAFPKKLSKWKLFVGTPSALKPAPYWVPYDINVPLFSDYAKKHRMVWLPPNKAASYDRRYVFKFPVGTVIAKTFAFPYTDKKGQLHTGVVETRLLIHVHFKGQKARWVTLPYVWDQARTEATLKVAGGARVITAQESPIKRSFTYVIPNVNECVTCHHRGDTRTPIGPKARNLNKMYRYTSGPQNQLLYWKKVGYLKGLPPLSQVPKTPHWSSFDASKFQPKLARAYLDTNCAHCHEQGGFAGSSAVEFNYWIQDPKKLGICKEPVAAGKASGGNTYDVVPGYPQQSILYFRLHSVDAALRMPELGRTIRDTQGLKLLWNWISGINRQGKKRKPNEPKGCDGSNGAPRAAAKKSLKARTLRKVRRLRKIAPNAIRRPRYNPTQKLLRRYYRKRKR